MSKIRFLAATEIKEGPNGGGVPEFDKGSGDLFETTGLPESGDENDAVDDEQQAVGGGAPATTLKGPPMKTPMEASEVQTPSLPQRAASILRKAAAEVMRSTNDRALARRIAAIARQVNAYAVDQLTEAPDDLFSTAGLPLSGDASADSGLPGGNEPPKNEVGADQSGEIKVWGTDAPKKDQVNASGPVASPIFEVTFQTKQARKWATGVAHVQAPSQKVARERFAAAVPNSRIVSATLLSGEVTQQNNSTKAPRKASPKKKTRKASIKPTTTWAEISNALKRTASSEFFNGGQIELRFDTAGPRVAELTGLATDSEGGVYPVGTVSFRLSKEDPTARVAHLEVHDAAVNNEVQTVGVPAKAAAKFASRWAKEITKTAKDILTR